MTRILLADDHAVVRKGVKETLEEIPGIVVRGEADNGEEALKRLAKEQADLVIMDISMPGRSGLEVLAEIKRRWPRIAVLIYTMHPEVELAAEAFKKGAAGYLTKETPLAELVHAVKKIVADGKFVPPATGAKLASHLAAGEHPPHQTLSEREFQILRLIAGGKSLKEIAQKLALNAKTISTYRTRLLEKMRLRTNADLTRYVVEHQI